MGYLCYYPKSRWRRCNKDTLLIEGTIYTALQSLKAEYSKCKGQRQLLHEQARKNLEGACGFDSEVTHSLGKSNRIPGHTSSTDLPQLVPAYTVHTVTTKCGSYLVEALTVLILCAHLAVPTSASGV